MELGPNVHLTFEAEVLGPISEGDIERVVTDLMFIQTGLQAPEWRSGWVTEHAGSLVATLKNYQRLLRKERKPDNE